MELTPAQAKQALIGLNLGLGTATWLVPRLSGRLFGITADENPAAPYLARLFGGRSLAMAAVLMDGDAQETDRWLGYSAALGAADVVAAVAGGMRGYLSKRAAIMTGATAAAAVTLAVIARREE